MSALSAAAPHRGRRRSSILSGNVTAKLTALKEPSMEVTEEAGGEEDVADDESDISYNEREEADLFIALRANDVAFVKDLLAKHPSLTEVEFGVFEGSDTKDLMPQVKSKRIYTYTGDPDKGFCTPMHVAAEAGHKELVLYLHGLDRFMFEIEDYREKTPAEKANGEAKEAFLEMEGKTKDEMARCEPEGLDRADSGETWGRRIKKLSGYDEIERVLYEGHWKGGKYDGKGTLYYEGTEFREYVGAAA
jgi:hypothetical protein